MHLLVLGAASEGVSVVPGQPVRGVRVDFVAVSNELGEVVEGIDAVELGGVDEAEEDVSDTSAFSSCRTGSSSDAEWLWCTNSS